MKILHVLHHSVLQLADGYATRSHAILRSQQRHGIEVVALTGAQHNGDEGGESTVDGIRYIRTPGGLVHGPSGWRELRKLAAVYGRLQRIVGVEKPDLIHVHSPVYNALAALVSARFHRLPVVYEIRAMWEDAASDRQAITRTSLTYRAARSLETFVCRRATAVTTICEGLKNEIVSRGIAPGRITVTPNAVDEALFQPRARDSEMAASLGLGHGPVFGFIGSLFAYEGVEDLLAAVDVVLRQTPAAQFLIVGSGECEGAIRALAAGYRNGEVIYLPRVPFSEVQRLYSVIDCFVYPRRRIRLTELVTPLKPLEALAMQRAVVASDVGGHRELVRDGETGVLFDADNRDALTVALCRLADEPDRMLHLGAAGRHYVLEQRTWSRVAGVYSALYDRILGSGVAPAEPAEMAAQV